MLGPYKVYQYACVYSRHLRGHSLGELPQDDTHPMIVQIDCQSNACVSVYAQEFPAVYCWAMHHAIHVCVAVVSLIVFVMAAAAFMAAELELNLVNRHPFAIAHSW